MPTKTKEKKVYLELIRIIAIFLVLYCHTGEYGHHFYMSAEGQFNYYLSIFLAAVCQISVPLFFMISGATLLNKDEKISYLLKHRVLKMVIYILIFVSFQYYWNIRYMDGISFDLHYALKLSWSGGAITQQWYLYAYLEFLLVLPFLRKMVSAIEDRNTYIYLFVLCLIIKGICPIIAYYSEWPAISLNVSILLDAIFYSMIGYFVEYKSQKIFDKGKVIVILWVAAVVAVVINTIINSRTYEETGNLLFSNIFSPIYCLVIFVSVKALFANGKTPTWLSKALKFLGSGVFGVYLFEPQVRETFFPIYRALTPVIHSYPALLLWLLAAVLCGCCFFGVGTVLITRSWGFWLKVKNRQ
ncbi:MAG: acyltransferase [Lachnospiraceae bacterium]|nr:acyltransferase [Lachnospiraceae bacterium]